MKWEKKLRVLQIWSNIPRRKKLNVTFRIVVVTVEQRERKDNKQTLIERK